MAINPSFDKNGLVRLLEEEKFNESRDLVESCKHFKDKVENFIKLTSQLLSILNSKRSKAEKAKKKAIGKRILTQLEKDKRSFKSTILETILKQKQNELERLESECQRVNNTGNMMLGHISNNIM